MLRSVVADPHDRISPRIPSRTGRFQPQGWCCSFPAMYTLKIGAFVLFAVDPVCPKFGEYGSVVENEFAG